MAEGMWTRPMTFAEIFRGIADGDLRLLAGFSLECLIMASPALLFIAAYAVSK